MKKLSFIFAMVLAAGTAMAQTAVINQKSGISDPASEQTATITQTGLNTANIYQNTEKMNVPSTPVKFDHMAAATQSGGAGNSIVISQVAEGLIYGATGEKNEAEATQVGSSNSMNQTQISGDWTSGGMDFDSYQEGTGNIGTQFGKKTSSDFDLFQNGEGNISYQGTTGEKTGVLAGDVKQIGEINNATQLFHGENVRYAGAVIDQHGEEHTAVQEFNGSTSMWNEASHADIIQHGEDHEAYQSQVGMGSYQKAEQYGIDNHVIMYSNGNFNKAFTIQDGTEGNIVIDQKQTDENADDIDDGNIAKVYQNGANSVAYVIQDGLENQVLGLFGDDYAINNNGSYLNVSQTGEDNVVRSQQTVGSASETVVQNGMYNTAIVSQY